MTEQQKSLLIELAAEMVRCQHMPSEFVEDWDIPKSTPMKTRRAIQASTSIARSQSVQWANRIRRIVDGVK